MVHLNHVHFNFKSYTSIKLIFFKRKQVGHAVRSWGQGEFSVFPVCTHIHSVHALSCTPHACTQDHLRCVTEPLPQVSPVVPTLGGQARGEGPAAPDPLTTGVSWSLTPRRCLPQREGGLVLPAGQWPPCLPLPRVLDRSPKAVMTKSCRPRGWNNRNLFSPHSGAWKSEI